MGLGPLNWLGIR